jgi:hypothetical protein
MNKTCTAYHLSIDAVIQTAYAAPLRVLVGRLFKSVFEKPVKWANKDEFQIKKIITFHFFVINISQFNRAIYDVHLQ